MLRLQGFEGIYYFEKDGKPYFMGLCESNYCKVRRWAAPNHQQGCRGQQWKGAGSLQSGLRGSSMLCSCCTAHAPMISLQPIWCQDWRKRARRPPAKMMGLRLHGLRADLLAPCPKVCPCVDGFALPLQTVLGDDPPGLQPGHGRLVVAELREEQDGTCEWDVVKVGARAWGTQVWGLRPGTPARRQGSVLRE